MTLVAEAPPIAPPVRVTIDYSGGGHVEIKGWRGDELLSHHSMMPASTDEHTQMWAHGCAADQLRRLNLRIEQGRIAPWVP